MKSGEGTAVQRPCGTMPSGTRKKVKAQEGTEPRGGEEGAGARPCQPGFWSPSSEHHGKVLVTSLAHHRDSVQLNEWTDGRMNA